MPNIDIDKLKSEIIAARSRREASGAKSRALKTVATDGREINDSLKSFFVNAGLDVEKLNELMVKRQRDARRAFEEQEAEIGKHAASGRAAFIHGIAGQREAFAQLQNASTNPTGQSSLIVLEKAIFILQEPHFETDFPVQLNVGEYDNWVKFNINTNVGSDKTSFVFYFLWENLSDYYAVVNVATPVTFNGSCSVASAPAVFSTNSCFLQLTTQLAPVEYWNQPPTMPASQQSAFQPVLDVETSAGGIFDFTDSDSHITSVSAPFNYQPFNLSYDIFNIPPNSVALFEVSVQIDYGIGNGAGNPAEGVQADFLSGDYAVFCPFVLLQLLTPSVAP